MQWIYEPGIYGATFNRWDMYRCPNCEYSVLYKHECTSVCPKCKTSLSPPDDPESERHKNANQRKIGNLKSFANHIGEIVDTIHSDINANEYQKVEAVVLE